MDKNPIVGRKAELDGIRNGLSSGGSAKGFLFTGKEGIGKSTLLQESWREISMPDNLAYGLHPISLQLLTKLKPPPPWLEAWTRHPPICEKAYLPLPGHSDKRLLNLNEN